MRLLAEVEEHDQDAPTACLAEEPYFAPPTYRHRDLAETALRYLEGGDRKVGEARLDHAQAHYRVRMAFFGERDAREALRPFTAGYADPRVPYVAETQRQLRVAEHEHEEAQRQLAVAKEHLDVVLAAT